MLGVMNIIGEQRLSTLDAGEELHRAAWDIEVALRHARIACADGASDAAAADRIGARPQQVRRRAPAARGGRAPASPGCRVPVRGARRRRAVDPDLSVPLPLEHGGAPDGARRGHDRYVDRSTPRASCGHPNERGECASDWQPNRNERRRRCRLRHHRGRVGGEADRAERDASDRAPRRRRDAARRRGLHADRARRRSSRDRRAPERFSSAPGRSSSVSIG